MKICKRTRNSVNVEKKEKRKKKKAGIYFGGVNSYNKITKNTALGGIKGFLSL